ncbi:hydrolase [Lactiplantibacillus sp. DA1]|nr:hydrolase [Lactiplantibacillus sp. DA1]MDV0430360.1 hydrolase [Lactiplantibacillus sp. DA1]
MRRILAISKALLTTGWLITIVLALYEFSRQVKRSFFM